MALYPAYADEELVPEYVRASATAFTIEEQRIARESDNTDHARALSDAILYRGPTGSPHFREWVRALLLMRGKADAPLEIFIDTSSSVHAVLSTRWQEYGAYYDITEREVDEIRANRNHFDQISTIILNELYAGGRNRASSAGISNMIEHLLHLQSLHRIADIDNILSEARVEALAPEFLVGLLRIKFPLRGQLKSWDHYHNKVAAELTARNIPDPANILRGLRAP